MRATFITLGLLLATTQARTLKSLVQQTVPTYTPEEFGLPSNCVLTAGPGGAGSPPVLVEVPPCSCALTGSSGAGLPPTGGA